MCTVQMQIILGIHTGNQMPFKVNEIQDLFLYCGRKHTELRNKSLLMREKSGTGFQHRYGIRCRRRCNVMFADEFIYRDMKKIGQINDCFYRWRARIIFIIAVGLSLDI